MASRGTCHARAPMPRAQRRASTAVRRATSRAIARRQRAAGCSALTAARAATSHATAPRRGRNAEGCARRTQHMCTGATKAGWNWREEGRGVLKPSQQRTSNKMVTRDSTSPRTNNASGGTLFRVDIGVSPPPLARAVWPPLFRRHRTERARIVFCPHRPCIARKFCGGQVSGKSSIL